MLDLHPNKESTHNEKKSFFHCWNNRVKLKKPIQCEKCKLQDHRFTKFFDTISSLYSHIIYKHNGNDKYTIPTKEKCLEKLQKFSDLMRGDSFEFQIFVKEWRLIPVDGKIKKIPIYGNFCPRCHGPSDEIFHHTNGLVSCTICNHIFQMQEMKNKVLEFAKRQIKNEAVK